MSWQIYTLLAFIYLAGMGYVYRLAVSGWGKEKPWFDCVIMVFVPLLLPFFIGSKIAREQIRSHL